MCYVACCMWLLPAVCQFGQVLHCCQKVVEERAREERACQAGRVGWELGEGGGLVATNGGSLRISVSGLIVFISFQFTQRVHDTK